MHGQELGEVVTRALVGRWDAPERTHLESASSSLASGAPIRVLVLLAWLEHATSLLTKSDSYATHRIWNALNIDTVMARLA